MKKMYIVQTLVTFVEYHVVEAEDEKKAERIALESDYNTSIHLSTQTMDVQVMSNENLDHLKSKDQYFFDGYATVDDENYLTYMKMDGTVNGNMPKTKIFFEKE